MNHLTVSILLKLIKKSDEIWSDKYLLMTLLMVSMINIHIQTRMHISLYSQ